MAELWCDKCMRRMDYSGLTQKLDTSTIQDIFTCPVCKHTVLLINSKASAPSLIKKCFYPEDPQ